MKNRVLLLLGILIIIVAIVLVFMYYKSNYKISDFTIINESDKIEDAKKYGDNVVGWLRVEGTNIDLPLIMIDDDTDVLNGKYQFAWTNSIPDGTGNRPAYISHNVRNVSSNPIVGDDTMNYFEQLMSFIYPDFIKDNQFIEFTDSKGDTNIYRVYAVALLNDDQNASFMDTYTSEEQSRYIKQSKRESMYTRFYGSNSYSFRVDARKLREGEDKIYAKVKTNENYEKIKERMEEGESNEKA